MWVTMRIREDRLFVGAIRAPLGGMNSDPRTRMKGAGWLRPLVVQNGPIRCLAYRDGERKLRHFWSHKVLRGPISVLDPEN